MILSVATIGWISTTLSAFATLSPVPLAYKLRVRGSLDGENLHPWFMMLVYDASVCIYAFNPDAYDGLPLKVWVLIDVIVASFLVLTSLKVMKDETKFDQYSFFLWSCGVVVPIVLLFINNISMIGIWMLLLSLSNAGSVFTSFYQILIHGYDEETEKSFDPLMLACRLLAGSMWSWYSYLIGDVYLLGCSLWATFCPLLSLLVYFMIHAKASAIRVANQIRQAELKNRFFISKKKVVSELKVIQILSKTTEDLNPNNMIPHRDCHSSVHPFGTTTTTTTASVSVMVTTATRSPLSSKKLHVDTNLSSVRGGHTMECSICISTIHLNTALHAFDEELGLSSGDLTNESSLSSSSQRAADSDIPQGITLRSGHMFCGKCLSRCAEHDMDTCPVCRREHELSPQVLKGRLDEYRNNYKDWRMGKAKGAKGEVDDISAPSSHQLQQAPPDTASFLREL